MVVLVLRAKCNCSFREIEEEVKIVKRILTVLVVALVMAALMVATAAPAFAGVDRVGPDKQFIKKEHSGTFVGGSKHKPPPG